MAKADEVVGKAVSAEERRTARRNIAEEEAALAARSKALAATRRAEAVERELEENKAQRKGA